MPANTLPAKSIRFADLWKNYPNNDPCMNPRTGKKAYDDQCAIRLGAALQNSGVSFSSFRGPRCEFGPPSNGMALRAQELAEWLQKKPWSGCPMPIPMTGKDFVKKLQGRTGIVFFKDYWLREGEKSPTGDHIDLWNISQLTPSFTTFLRFRLGIARMPNFVGSGNYYSDLGNSRQILFWQLP